LLQAGVHSLKLLVIWYLTEEIDFFDFQDFKDDKDKAFWRFSFSLWSSQLDVKYEGL